MADHKNCKYYAVCDYRNDVGVCPDRCVQYKHKDDVRVVRCKDCKYWEQGKDYEPYCNHWGNMMADNQADDYCSYGERKDNERKAD